MPLAELQRLLGPAADFAVTQTGLLSRRQELMPRTMPNYGDDIVGAQSACCEALWIDMGGEG